MVIATNPGSIEQDSDESNQEEDAEAIEIYEGNIHLGLKGGKNNVILSQTQTEMKNNSNTRPQTT